jgi:hypothetical protein
VSEATRVPSNRIGIPASPARCQHQSAAAWIASASVVATARLVCRPVIVKSARLIFTPTVDPRLGGYMRGSMDVYRLSSDR